MSWTYNLYAERIGDAAFAREGVASAAPTSIWAIGPPPGDGSPGWLIGLRFVSRDSYPVLAELRAFPDEGLTHERAHGEWSGDPDAVPGLGLAASTIKNLSVKTMETQVRAALSDPRDRAWGDSPDLALPDGEPSDNWIEWYGATKDLEIDTANTADRNKRGRKPLPDELLAMVAYHYTEALQKGVKVHNYVRAEIRSAKRNPNAGTLIKRARQEGFLPPATKSGQKGGTITPKGLAVLEASGFLDSQQSHNDRPQGEET